jgi:hypothetical protein
MTLSRLPGVAWPGRSALTTETQRGKSFHAFPADVAPTSARSMDFPCLTAGIATRLGDGLSILEPAYIPRPCALNIGNRSLRQFG